MSLVISAFAFCTESSFEPGEKKHKAKFQADVFQTLKYSLKNITGTGQVIVQDAIHMYLANGLLRYSSQH